MSCPFALMCCVENVSPGKALRGLVVFITSFLLIFLYLNSSEFTAWTTALWTSFLIALFYTLGIVSNVYCRCAALVFFIHLFFSKFGLLMLFISSSWMTLQVGLGAFRKNQKLENKILMEIAEDDLWNPNLAFVDDILGTIHYFSLVPYLCNFLYSLLYEITFECRRIERRNREDPHGSIFYLCVRLFKYFICIVVGGCALLISGVYLCQWHTYENLVSKFNNKGKDPSVLVANPRGWAIFYFVFCIGLIVLSTFSRYLIRFRKTIIRKYFDFTPRNVKSRHRHNYLTKPYNKKTEKEYQKRYKLRKMKGQKSESVSDDGSVVLNVRQQEVGYTRTERKNESPFLHKGRKASSSADKTYFKRKGKGKTILNDEGQNCKVNIENEREKYFFGRNKNEFQSPEPTKKVSNYVFEEDDNIAERLENVRSKVQFDSSSDSDDQNGNTKD